MIERIDNPLQESTNIPYLFIEGSFQSIDFSIRKLLSNKGIALEVKPLGGSPNIKAAASNLIEHFPNWFFLIDRDYCKIEEVNKSWKQFLDESTNLLIWRKREFENYFLDPDYLMSSETLAKTVIDKPFVESLIKTNSRLRLFSDVINTAIKRLNEKFKTESDTSSQNWVRTLSYREYSSKSEALEHLKKYVVNAISIHKNRIDKTKIEDEFHDVLNEFVNNENDKLNFGTGEWENLIRGKEVLEKVFQSICIELKKTGFEFPKQVNFQEYIIAELLADGEIKQPDDFQQLCTLLKNRIN